MKIIDQRFTTTTQAINIEVSKWQAIPPEDKTTIEKHFDELFARFKELRDYIANYSYSIPNYNLQQYQSTLDNLNDYLVKEKEAALPKKKFTFARK